MAKKVDFKNKMYRKMISVWNMIDDMCDGDERDGTLRKYLSELNPQDKSEDNKIRNNQYYERALFYEIPGYTVNGLLGMAFRREPKIELPAELEYIKEDVDGDGNYFMQQMIDTFEGVVKKGRQILIVDMPPNSGSVSVADVNEYGIVPHIKTVKAQNVIDWSLSVIGGKSKLSRLSILDYMEDDDGKEFEQITLYELIGGVCTVNYYEKHENDMEFSLNSERAATIYHGNKTPLSYIPAICIGSKNNSWFPDSAPMKGICNITRAQYNNSAAYEDSVYYVGQVQPWMSGLTQEHVDFMKKTGQYIGSREMLAVPIGGQFGMEQAGANSLAKEAINDKTDMAIGLGALFVQKGTAVKTASQYNGEQAVSHSVLSLCSNNVSDGYESALEICCDFLNTSSDVVEVELSQDFTLEQADPNMVNSLFAAFQGGGIRKKDMLRYFQKTEIISADDDLDEVETELQNSDVPPINLNDPNVE